MDGSSSDEFMSLSSFENKEDSVVVDNVFNVLGTVAASYIEKELVSSPSTFTM